MQGAARKPHVSFKIPAKRDPAQVGSGETGQLQGSEDCVVKMKMMDGNGFLQSQPEMLCALE
jgi:hypothetical protein